MACFSSIKLLEKLDNALQANDNIFFYNEDFNKVTFISCQRHIVAEDIDKINLIKVIIFMKMILMIPVM